MKGVGVVGWDRAEGTRERGNRAAPTGDRRRLGLRLASFAGLSPFNSFIVITLKMPLYIE